MNLVELGCGIVVAAVLRLRHGGHAWIVGDHPAVNVAVVRGEIRRRGARVQRYFHHQLFSVRILTCKVVEELRIPRPFGFIIGFVIYIEGRNQHALLQILEPRLLENALQNLPQVFLIIIRARDSADVANVIKPGIIKNLFPLVPIERDHFIHRFPGGQTQRDDAARGRAREQIRTFD